MCDEDGKTEISRKSFYWFVYHRHKNSTKKIDGNKKKITRWQTLQHCPFNDFSSKLEPHYFIKFVVVNASFGCRLGVRWLFSPKCLLLWYSLNVITAGSLSVTDQLEQYPSRRVCRDNCHWHYSRQESPLFGRLADTKSPMIVDPLGPVTSIALGRPVPSIWISNSTDSPCPNDLNPPPRKKYMNIWRRLDQSKTFEKLTRYSGVMDKHILITRNGDETIPLKKTSNKQGCGKYY